MEGQLPSPSSSCTFRVRQIRNYSLSFNAALFVACLIPASALQGLCGEEPNKAVGFCALQEANYHTCGIIGKAYTNYKHT